LGVSELKQANKDRLATELPSLVAAVFNLKAGDRLVWCLGRGELRVRVLRAEEAAPEGDEITHFLG
jgi:hypothetical protein